MVPGRRKYQRMVLQSSGADFVPPPKWDVEHLGVSMGLRGVRGLGGSGFRGLGVLGVLGFRG